MKKTIGFIIKFLLFVDAIIAGIIVFFAFRKKQEHAKRDLKQDIFILFGGKKDKLTKTTIESPMYSVYFGGLDLDLSEAEVEGDYLNMDVEVMCGGVNLVVPDHWNITINNLGTIFGGVSKDFESDLETAIVDVMVNVRVTFGGVNITRISDLNQSEEIELEDDEIEKLETWEANEGYEEFVHELNESTKEELDFSEFDDEDLDDLNEISDIENLDELEESQRLIDLKNVDDLNR